MLVVVTIVVIGLLALAAVGLVGLNRFLANRPQDIELLPRRTVTQNGLTLHVLVPETEEQKGRGLSGIEALPANTGLLLRSVDGDTRISMLGMRFPLDLVWLDDQCAVLHVVAAAAPGPWPLSHSSPHQASAVLELSSGDAARYGLDRPGAQMESCP
ncbi:DUF192 domain-containing protein [Paramicrobacterium sp. CJ85]|uniref:DUF192 domain-containing protein n=1 Tax=Paramicrobacterium sp. CJ85 TaxID=3445355 RepID=UPI003F60F5F1